MVDLVRLQPAFPTERLYPKDAAYMSRTDAAQMRLLGTGPSILDSVTSLLIGLLNGRPTVRHRSCVTDEILEFLDWAGVTVNEDIRRYDTAEEAERLGDQLIEEGYRIFSTYPLRSGRFPAEAQLVAPDLYKRINAKENLERLVSRENLAPRSIHAIAELAARRFEQPVFLKAANDAATGFGYAVRYCASQAEWDKALDWFRAWDLPRVIVEQALPVEVCWCVAIAVEPNQANYVGAAEQVFDAPAHQIGSVIDDALPFPPDGIDLAIAVGEAARREGFVGLGGLDIGRLSDQRLIVFDPNFRTNASSAQVFFHRSAARRADLSVSWSFDVWTLRPLAEIKRLIEHPIGEGWLVPTRFIDGKLLPAAEGRSRCTGFVLAADRASAAARARDLAATLSA